MLLTFFFTFCALTAVIGYFGWQYYTNAMMPVEDTVLLANVNGVLYQPPDKTVAQDIVQPTARVPRCEDKQNLCVPIPEGWRVVAKPGIGYGSNASLKLIDGTQIDLHGYRDGAALKLKTYKVSRWTNQRQDVVIEHDTGYARYDVASGQSYKHINYTVEIGNDIKVYLSPGGSYSINVLRDLNGEPHTRLVTNEPILAEIAVRSGNVTVQSGNMLQPLRSNEKVHVALDGTISTYEKASWELIADGNFARHTNEQYNNPDGTDTWKLSNSVGVQNMPVAEQNGEFRVIKTCPPQQRFCSANQQIHYGTFRREGPQTNTFITGIEQRVNADISEYKDTLLLTAWVSVLKQEPDLAGQLGSECPIMIHINYKWRGPADAPLTYKICIYTSKDDKPKDIPVKDYGVNNYYQVSRFSFEQLAIDLREVERDVREENPGQPNISEAWYIESIRIEARGHEYLSQITDISLVGSDTEE
jgi:hypothetical protein